MKSICNSTQSSNMQLVLVLNFYFSRYKFSNLISKKFNFSKNKNLMLKLIATLRSETWGQGIFLSQEWG